MTYQAQASAKTDAFILNEATIMLGPLGLALDLTEEEHSIGLFKDLQVQNSRSYTDLKQGVRQDIIQSVLTADDWSFTSQGAEFSPRQLAYYLGQDGSKFTTEKTSTTTLSAPVAEAASQITVASGTGFAVGNYINISQAGDNNGLIFKIEAITANSITLDRPTVAAFVQGAVVYKLNALRSASESCTGSNYYSCKIVSQTVGCEPIIIVLPKIQITSGLNLNFGASDFMMTPLEFKTLASLPTDASYELYAEHGNSEFIHFSRAFTPKP